MQYSDALFSRPTAASNVWFGKFVRLIVCNNNVKFCDPRLSHCLEIRPKAIGDGILEFLYSNFQLEASSDVTSSVAEDNVNVDVRIKCGESRSNRS